MLIHVYYACMCDYVEYVDSSVYTVLYLCGVARDPVSPGHMVRSVANNGMP